jgi:anion-transporting  ArsA/GET3 family ATPase
VRPNKGAGPLGLEQQRLLICLGPGGVGKTTLSAALAINAAQGGRAVDVMTVDPAPRLLDALGLAGAESIPQTVPLEGLAPRSGGRLRALKLDPKRTFDALVARYAPSPSVRDAILSDRIYHNLSSALAGVADYMAMEQLLELHLDYATDLVVLDTPPAREALDFLDAPRRMIELLGSRAIALLGAGRDRARVPLSLLDLAARAVLSAFDRLTGLHLLTDVQSFVRRFEGMYGGFAERAFRAQELIRDEHSLIVLVTTAEAERVEQAREFATALSDLGLRLGAVVVNRVMAPIPDRASLERLQVPIALKRKLKQNLKDFAALKQRENTSLAALRDGLPARTPLVVAPDLGREPRSISDLAEIAASLHVA